MREASRFSIRKEAKFAAYRFCREGEGLLQNVGLIRGLDGRCNGGCGSYSERNAEEDDSVDFEKCFVFDWVCTKGKDLKCISLLF